MRAGLVLVLLLGACGLGHAAAHIRGVQPELSSKYEPTGDGKWTCLDGSKIIDFDRVNDLYCDCPDGSDEPGTPACPNGVFYCRNRGHEARILSTAFVDDGVCDCCDGTDELEGCTNTCIEKNAAVRESLKQKVEDYRRALDKRREYAAGAAEARQKMQDRLANIDADIAAAEQEVQRLSGEREKLQGTAEERKAARIVARKEELERLKADKAKADAEAAAAAAAAAAEVEAAAAAAAAAVDAEAKAEGEGGAAGAEGEKEETAEERGRRIAAQWTNDPEAAGKAAEAEAGSTEDAAKDSNAPAEGGSAGGGWLTRTWSSIKETLAGATGASTGGDPDADAEPLPDKPDPEEEGGCEEAGTCGAEEHGDEDLGDMDTDPEMEAANTAFNAAEDQVTTLKAEKERLSRQVGYDYGADDAWVALASHCSEAREPQYSYRLCLFDKAAQVDNHGGHETSLGAWKGFEKGYTEGVFDNGDWCHQAPARSMRVKFECGLDESAWGGSEPATCAYAASMATPAACKEDDLKLLEDRLAALLREEEELAKEIAEEEEARKAAYARGAAEAEAAMAGADRSEL